jgi:hypothetical protein
MHLLRELILECSEQIDKLVRLVAAFGVAELSVDELLQNEMSHRVMRKVGRLKHYLEVADVAVQIACHDYVAAVLEIDDMPAPARSRPNKRDGLAEMGQHPIRGGQSGSSLGAKPEFGGAGILACYHLA